MTHKDKEAQRAYNKAYHTSHKLEYKFYYEIHRDEICARKRAYRKAHPEKAKKYFESNKEKIQAQSNAYNEAHKAEMKDYYESHKDLIKSRSKEYYKAHKSEVKAYLESNRLERLAQRKAYRNAHQDEIKAKGKTYREASKKEIICVVCGAASKSSHESRFCSDKCQGKWYTGPRSHGWKGGISMWPYCPKFNNALKEEIRDKFGHRCFLSGKKENGKKLDIHHCDYLKSQGCQGQRWSLLPLEHSWHSKTNANRWFYFSLLRDYWAYKYLTFHGMDIFDGPSRTEWLWEMYNSNRSV